MIFQAMRELNVDLAGAVIVGDRATDIRAGRAAGIRTVLVGDEASRARERTAGKPDAEYDSLLAFARALSEREVFSR
jgi:D-glycero-D-manno-heptose 1,7-bisphosphate phosphatase